MFSNFDFAAIYQALPYLFFTGMVFTLKLTAISAICGTLLGTVLALMRLSGLRGLPQIAAAYVNLVRSLPLLLVIFWFYFLVPYIAQAIAGSERPITIEPFVSALITFTMFEAAYFSEIMRAGIQSLAKGQVWAGYALGLRHALHIAPCSVWVWEDAAMRGDLAMRSRKARSVSPVMVMA